MPVSFMLCGKGIITIFTFPNHMFSTSIGNGFGLPIRKAVLWQDIHRQAFLPLYLVAIQKVSLQHLLQ
jgi:hypothetical protein